MQYVNVSGVVVAPPKSKCNTCLQRLVLHFQSIFQCFRRVVAPPKWKCDMCAERHMSMLQALPLRPQNGSVTRVCNGSVEAHRLELHLEPHTSMFQALP